MSDAGHLSWTLASPWPSSRYEFEWRQQHYCLRSYHDDPVCILSTPSCWWLSAPYLQNTFCTVSICRVKHLGKRNPSTFFYVELTVAFHSTIVRDLYMTLCSFIRRCGNLIKYHRATANMDQRYPNATATELATMDRVCIICREEMVAVPGNAPLAEAVCIAARAAVGVAGAVQAVSLIVLTPTLQNGFLVANVFHLPLSTRQSVMDIPAQAPVQPAIVNPVAAVNPIATQCYLDQFQHLGAPPVQMEFPGGHGMAQAPIYLTPTWSCSIVDANASEL
ncbi:hypothetical protein BASA62_008043 [Batrachochytrium salamandrivorans]|nr:hypothetical protein BASA62_008043 [Batrachochytrium salamandrivorans]